MPANSFAQGEYAIALAIPTKHGNAQLVYAQATMVGGVPVTDAALSAPGCTIVRTGVGVYQFSHPNCQVFIPLSDPMVLAAEQLGTKGYWEALSPLTGLELFETAITPGTDADPANGSVIYVAGLAVQTR